MSMLPVDEVHHIAETAHHAVTACRNLFRLRIHQGIRVLSGRLALCLFQLTEPVSEPTHDQSGFEGERLVLPDARDCMTIDPHPPERVGLTTVGIEFILPEAAAKHDPLSRFGRAHADGAELAVAAGRYVQRLADL